MSLVHYVSLKASYNISGVKNFPLKCLTFMHKKQHDVFLNDFLEAALGKIITFMQQIISLQYR